MILRHIPLIICSIAIIATGATTALAQPAPEPWIGDNNAATFVGAAKLDADSGDGTPKQASSSVSRDSDGQCASCGDDDGCCRKSESAMKKEKEKKKKLAQAVAGAYKGVFYDNDFGYLLKPEYQSYHLGAEFKRMKAAKMKSVPGVIVDVGGQYRLRYHHENNMRGLGLTGRDDDFLLQRTRLYGNLEFGGCVRLYLEYLDATSSFENLNPRPIEENRSDLLNAFGDLKLLETCDGQLWARVGRQELLYGAQRTVSPLDWGNTRRTFDGAKLFWRGKDVNVDAFWTRPVFPDSKNFDEPDNSQEFLGVYATLKRFHQGQADLYFLRYAEDNGATDFNFNTFGVRYQGSGCDWLWELEGAYQFGEFGAAEVSAGAYTVGIGRRFKNLCWKPTIWAYFDWAAGSSNRGAGYHHLFPLAHKYLGFMDLFGRRNLEDWNFQLTVQPTKKVKFLLWFHVFQLQNGADIPYSLVMGPSPAPGFAVVPGGSKNLGQELDLLIDWKITDRLNCVVGYSHFWAGDWFRTNPTAGLFQGDGDFFFTQWAMNF